ncbi:Protein XRI [Trema orientale]|uniref:Protein XRI n=1 Tax=Trema orientale TaxID=63057 RepID=A0A2P5CIF1_TREOI|nr:Protein XRI [Trema orientale]
MDYHNDKSEQWGWQRENYCFQKDSNHETSEGLWNGVPQNEEDISYMFDDETTPVKACGDLAYHVGHKDNLNKEAEECRESFSQLKRRRMLQFTNEEMDTSLCCEEMSSAFLKSNERIDSLEETLTSASDWISGFAEDTSASASGYETLDQSSDGWITDCFNDPEMHFSPDTLNPSGASDFQIDISEFCEIAPENENDVPQQRVSTPQKIIFKGRKSYIRTPSKLATSVAYPFAFIKPSGAHGDVTLKEINQRIRTPPPSKSKKKNEEPSISYPTSAFSGKPVVGKTKIHTEGGKGSITIMRTKG